MSAKKKVLILLITVLVLALALIIFLLVSGRLGPDAGTVDDPAGDDGGSGLGFEPIPPVDDPVYGGDSVAGSPFVGGFKNTFSKLFNSSAEAAYIDEDKIPALNIDASGSFKLTINATELGMKTLTGTLRVSGDAATFSVAERSEAAFPGDDLAAFEFTFALINENELRYSGPELGTLMSGDIFERV